MSDYITYQSQLAHLDDLHRQAVRERRFAGGRGQRTGKSRPVLSGTAIRSLKLRPGVILRRVFSTSGLG